MLINTVVLFLQDSLPIFILVSLLLLVSEQFNVKKHWLHLSVVLSIFIGFLLNKQIAFISQSYDYTGMERLFSLGFSAVYFTISLLFVFSQNKRLFNYIGRFWLICLVVAVTFTATLNSISFVLYFNSYWQQQTEIEPLFLAIVLGIGISMSIAILLYFIVSYLNNNIYANSARLLLLTFGVGQLMEVSHLLEQIDLLSSSHFIWNSSTLVPENSALGYFLVALFGYDATPNMQQLLGYIIALLLPIATVFMLVKRFPSSIENLPSQEVLK